MWILISWLLMKPADLDLHCFQVHRILKRYCIQCAYKILSLTLGEKGPTGAFPGQSASKY